MLLWPRPATNWWRRSCGPRWKLSARLPAPSAPTICSTVSSAASASASKTAMRAARPGLQARRPVGNPAASGEPRGPVLRPSGKETCGSRANGRPVSASVGDVSGTGYAICGLPEKLEMLQKRINGFTNNSTDSDTLETASGESGHGRSVFAGLSPGVRSVVVKVRTVWPVSAGSTAARPVSIVFLHPRQRPPNRAHSPGGRQ